ncbi:MAG: acetolactate synthase [Phycisphaera sp.]|nr:acetolactate synthase [Phycisphaera sp.]
MSQAPVDQATTGGYETPRNIQFSVFLDNRCGKLLELLKVFENQAVQLVGLSILDSADHAVVRILTSRSELARRLLIRHGLPFSEAEVLVFELRPEQPLSFICTTLLAAELNIFYVYPLIVRPHSHPAYALSADDLVTAGQALRRKLIHLLAENDLGTNQTGGDPFDISAN